MKFGVSYVPNERDSGVLIGILILSIKMFAYVWQQNLKLIEIGSRQRKF